MEPVAILVGLARELGVPGVLAALFVVALMVAQRLWGGWFEMARAAQAGSDAAQAKVNASMLALIERLNAEIKRLGETEERIMLRLRECEERHRARDSEFEKIQSQVAALNIKLFNVGLGNPKQ